MSERDDRSAERRGGEGVRIIGPEEAQAALDAGQAAGRRAEDELRFGDVPPAPSGPRPPHRFPLPDSVDPAAAVPRPPIVPPVRGEPTAAGRGRSVSADAAHDPRPWPERGSGSTEDADPSGAGGADPTSVLPAAPAPEDAPEGAPPTDMVPAAEVDEERPPAGPPAPAAGHETPLPGAAAPSPWTEPSGGAPPWPPQPAPRAVPSTEPAAGGLPSAAPAWEPAVAEHPAPPPVPATPEYRGPWSERPASFTAPARESSGWTPPEPAPPAPDLALPDEGITVTGFGTELPHWTDPPTGEVPRIRPEPADDDLAAWEALGAQGSRWRDDTTGWGEPGEIGDLAGDEPRVGALDQSRTEHSDLYSFDEDFERLEEERSGSHRAVGDDFDEFADLDEVAEPVAAGSVRAPRTIRSRPPRPPRSGPPSGEGGSRVPGGTDLGSRFAVGIGLVVLLIIAYFVGPVALLVLSAAVIVAAAIEVYGMLQHSGFRPATLLGLVATVGVVFAAYWRGAGALPLIVGLVFVISMLWYLLGIVEARPLANVAVTVTAFVWIGVLGSYAALLLRAHHGKGLFLGAVLPAVAADIVAYFVGRQMGSRLLAPRVSPAKTLEGAIGGGIAAIVVGLVVGHSISPWGGTKHGLLLGVVVAVVAPIGDLFESMIKRDLDVKDSGSVLPGHGGVLDRFDSVLLVLPAAFYLASLFNVAR